MQLQRSCRHWRLAAIELFYSQVSIVLDIKEGRQNQFIESLGDSGNPARHFVRELVVDKQWAFRTVSRDYALFSALGSLCPNLMNIESNEPTRQFYKEVLNLRQAGHLLKVEHIREPIHSNTKYYYRTVMAFKDTLAELLVNRDLDIDLPQTGSIKTAFKIADHLGEFKCLKRLHIDLAQDVALHKIEELLALCSNSSMLQTVKVTMATRKKEEVFNDTRVDVQGLGRLLGVSKLTLINREHLSIQDMVYVMHKFPKLRHLHFTTEGCHSEKPEDGRDTSEVIQQFSQYISRLDRCHISLLKATPALILDAVTQLSKGFKVDELTFHASDEIDDEKCAYLKILEPTRMQRISHSVHVILPTLHVDPLYQTALEAFAPQVKKIRLYGTMNPKGALTNALLFSNVQIATDRVLSESVKFILSNFAQFKKLYLYNLIISTRTFTEAPATKLQLDDLYIYQCALNPHTLHHFSQYLDYVERFRLQDIAYWTVDDSTIIKGQRNYNVDMPYTAFGTIFLPNDGRVESILVKSCSGTTTKHFLCRRNHVGSYKLTEQGYNEIKKLKSNAPSIHVRCRYFRVIEFGSHRLSFSE